MDNIASKLRICTSSRMDLNFHSSHNVHTHACCALHVHAKHPVGPAAWELIEMTQTLTLQMCIAYIQPGQYVASKRRHRDD